MPLYDYHCDQHGSFRAWRGLSEARAPVPCPGCDQPAPRLVVAPSLGILPSVTRRAHERNEKSAHEPRVMTKESGAGDHGHTHAHGHAGHSHGQGHSHGHRHGAGGRPWMIGH
jgi:putative FmdB family regulatory protein